MFVRKKKIKGNDYAYLVENMWTKKGSRQKVRAYLGKIYYFEQVKNISLEENNDRQKLLKNLIECEFLKHGFEKQGNEFVNKDLVVSFENNLIKIKNSDLQAAFAFNQGYLCNYFIEKLFNLQIAKKEKEKQEAMLDVAKLFVNAGINVPQEVFIKFYNLI